MFDDDAQIKIATCVQKNMCHTRERERKKKRKISRQIDSFEMRLNEIGVLHKYSQNWVKTLKRYARKTYGNRHFKGKRYKSNFVPFCAKMMILQEILQKDILFYQ